MSRPGSSPPSKEPARRKRDADGALLHEVFGSDEGVEARVEGAALAILFSVAAAQLDAGVSVVAESNFGARTDVGPLRRLAEEHRPRFVQVHCSRNEENLLGDFAGRAASGRRHPGHGDSPADTEEVRVRARTRLTGGAVALPCRGGD